MGYLLDHCLFDRLSDEVINQCQPYKCSKDSDIDSFFHKGTDDNFSDYQIEMMGYSHCFYTDEELPKMVCAFSLSNSALRTDILPRKRRNRLNRDIPNTKRRSQYPAILIGQLCVFDGFGHHKCKYNIGDEMMDLIKTIAINPDNVCAARYLVVDAINKPEVIEYYKRNGFNFLFDSDEEELKCLRYFEDDRSVFKKLKNVLHPDRKEALPKCRTRLMWFDLIVLNP